MTFVFQARNYGDVMFHQAFGRAKQDCYVDAGEKSPVVDSVIKTFYERGWRSR
jgi:hypothetical protein